jgi:hypothetical protein
MPTTPSRGEPIKSVGDNSGRSNPGVTANIIADANGSLTIAVTDAVQHQFFGIPFVTI